MKLSVKVNCNFCNKGIQTHKIKIKCDLCRNVYHPKCNGLKPSDVRTLTELSLINSWTCAACVNYIFPLLSCASGASGVGKATVPKRPCYTCNKLGTRLQACDLCGKESHARCFAGPIGCKTCMHDIIPGFNVNVFDLFPNRSHLCDKLFNPFDRNSDINNVGFRDNEEADYEQIVWAPCSNILKDCKYREFKSISASRDSELKVLSLNVHSLNSKIAKIKDDLKHFSKFDVLCFNETLCSQEELPFAGKELELDAFYSPVIQSPARKSNLGGGLAIYINKNLCAESDFKILTALSDNTNYEKGEFLFIEISRKNDKNILIGNMYRSPAPSANIIKFIDNLESRLKLLERHSNKLVVLTCDSNINLLNFESHENTNRYLNLLSEHGFVPVISRPTRITYHSATLIDHIFVNNCMAVTNSGIITADLSDHLAPFVNILIKKEKRQILEDSGTWRQINDENLELFKSEILSTDWSSITNIESANDKYTAFESIYREIYEKCFPHKTKRAKKEIYDKPWMQQWLKCACERKNKLHKIFVTNPTISNESKYKTMKKFVAKHIKRAKRAYYKNYFNKYSNDSRKQWTMINQLLNRKPKSKIKISKLVDGENTITNTHDIANKFNNFFCNVAQRLKDESGHPGELGRPPESTLNNSKRSYIKMDIADCTTDEIEKIINSLKNKATSDLAISPLKFVSKEIAPIVQHLLYASLNQGIFPDLLKCAKVIPLYKSGSRSDVTNYRPISLLSCFSKIYEKIMQKQLNNFLKENRILFDSQYGFRSGHSCEHALLEAQNFLNVTLDKNQIAALLLIDFSKAFDMVDHEILLNKLDHYGIRGINLSWFRSYLTGRQQYVHVSGVGSERLHLKYSVPQGSILGPILFILYVNDLPEISKLAKFIFFADDANIIVTGQNFIEIQEKINELLNTIDRWVKLNGLKLNIKKTKFMIFTNRRDPVHSFNIHFNGVNIDRVDSERFLGVILQSNLSWNKHITSLASKISRNAGVIFRLKGLVPPSVLKTLYNSLVQSHLNYCSNIWGLGSKSSRNKIFVAQKKAVRAADPKFNNCFYNRETGELPCHTKNIFNRNNILTIHSIVAKNCLVAMHKIYLCTAPSKIDTLFQYNKSPDYNTRRKPQYFAVPSSRLVALDSTMYIRGPKLYNYVLAELNKNQTSSRPENKFLNPFKALVTKYLVGEQGKGGIEWEDQNYGPLTKHDFMQK